MLLGSHPFASCVSLQSRGSTGDCWEIAHLGRLLHPLLLLGRLLHSLLLLILLNRKAINSLAFSGRASALVVGSFCWAFSKLFTAIRTPFLSREPRIMHGFHISYANIQTF